MPARALDAFPGAAEQKDPHGQLPLHMTLNNNASETTVQAVLNAFPGMAEQKDCNGDFPLHLALTYYVSETTVQAVLDAFPGAAQQNGCCGRSPLHVALAGTCPEVGESRVWRRLWPAPECYSLATYPEDS